MNLKKNGLTQKTLTKLALGLALLMLCLIACTQTLEQSSEGALFLNLESAQATHISSEKQLNGRQLLGVEVNIDLLEEPLPESTPQLDSQAILPGSSGFLAYYRSNNTVHQLWTQNQTTGKKQNIFNTQQAIQSVAVSNDGQWVSASILTNGQYDIYAFDVSKNKIYNLTNSATTHELDISMNSTATRFAFTTKEQGSSVVQWCDFDLSSNSCALSTLVSSANQSQASLSAGGNYLVLIRDLGVRTRVLRYEIAANQYKTVVTRTHTLSHPSITDNGNQVMYLRKGTSKHPDRYLVRIKDLNSNTIHSELASSSAEHPFITADAKALAYSLRSSSFNRVFSRIIETNERASVAGGSWHYDGAYWQLNSETSSCKAETCWAFEETFDGDPNNPSQDLLPTTFDYVVTHRSHPQEHFTKTFGPYLADHGDDCAGPNPELQLAPQHNVISSHLTNGGQPDKSFFICKNHMMSSLGDVDGYSVSAFWPKQDFDFSENGILEFDVNINDNHRRSWFEIMITPREELKVGAAREDLPIDETYPKNHIVLIWGSIEADSSRFIQLGKDQLAPEGLYVEAKDYRTWRRDIAPNDPALSDRRKRRTMRISLKTNQIIWEVQKEDGSFDPFIVDIPEGLPFNKGLVVFKTHAYTPVKDGNTNTYTFHWDNIRFSGPVTGTYKTYEADASDVIYLQQNGDRDIGESQEITIDLPELGKNPVLFGQVNNPQEGQVLVSLNGADPRVVSPYDYEDKANCHTDGWQSFRLELSPLELKTGVNTFNWIIGPRPTCSNTRFYPWDTETPIATGSGFYPWNGFSIKNLEIQIDE